MTVSYSTLILLFPSDMEHRSSLVYDLFKKLTSICLFPLVHFTIRGYKTFCFVLSFLFIINKS